MTRRPELTESLWFTYILKCADGTLYTGKTNDIRRRIHEHNHTKKGAKYTKSRRPVRLVYWWGHDTEQAALKMESDIKKKKRTAKMDFILHELVMETKEKLGLE